MGAGGGMGLSLGESLGVSLGASLIVGFDVLYRSNKESCMLDSIRM